MKEKRNCSRCGLSKPISEYKVHQFGRYISYCKTCQEDGESCAEYDRLSKERAAARLAKWNLDHPGSANEGSRRHKEANRDKVNARRRELHALNAEHDNLVKREWRAANQESENKKSRESMQRWRDANKEQVRFLNHIHRARKTSDSPDHHTMDDVLDIMRLQKGKCAYCKKDIRKNFEIDHIKAIVNGGHNGRQNIQLTCMPCNRSKNSKDPLVFARRLGRLL